MAIEVINNNILWYKTWKELDTKYSCALELDLTELDKWDLEFTKMLDS